jgi:hypothetical protein
VDLGFSCLPIILLYEQKRRNNAEEKIGFYIEGVLISLSLTGCGGTVSSTKSSTSSTSTTTSSQTLSPDESISPPPRYGLSFFRTFNDIVWKIPAFLARERSSRIADLRGIPAGHSGDFAAYAEISRNSLAA